MLTQNNFFSYYYAKNFVMNSFGFNRYGLDRAGIHWAQHLAMTIVSLLIFLIALDKAVPAFHNLLISSLYKIECSGLF